MGPRGSCSRLAGRILRHAMDRTTPPSRYRRRPGLVAPAAALHSGLHHDGRDRDDAGGVVRCDGGRCRRDGCRLDGGSAALHRDAPAGDSLAPTATKTAHSRRPAGHPAVPRDFQPLARQAPVRRSSGALRGPRQRAGSPPVRLASWSLPNRLRRRSCTDSARRPGLPLAVVDSDGGPGVRGGDVQSCRRKGTG